MKTRNNTIFTVIALFGMLAITPVTAQRLAHRPAPHPTGGRVTPGSHGGGTVRPDVNRTPDRTPDRTPNVDRDININDNTNINRNVNINNNIDVHGNTYVRPVPYHHTTVIVYHHYSGFRPYYYHPFYPYAWGPAWHPLGWFCAELAVTAVVVAIVDAASKPEYPEYYYDQGVYYAKSGNGYAAVAPPAGAVIKSLPSGYDTVVADSKTYYYYGGVFYSGSSGSYKVVKAPVGAVVEHLPQGAQETDVNGSKLMEYQGTFYQPVMNNGQSSYEVVTVQQ